ncbi:MAG: aldehyde dehydrogenase family protein, partial [Tepidisphaeraceae bacterium]
LWTVKQPVGVAGLITIWNFPLAGITRPLGAALAAGCAAVVKPAEETPLCAIAVFEILEQAGLPAGVANLITAIDPAPIGDEFFDSPLVRKLSFTGSLEVGRLVMRRAAEQIKRVTLELGGHAPMIVFDDANIDLAVSGAAASKFRNAGQTCVAVNRIYVQERIREQFTARFVEHCKSLRVGDPLDESVRVGPLINAAAIDKVDRHVQDAIARGAKLLTGGNRISGGNFYPPTVLTDVAANSLILHEETFGPVAPIIAFTGEDEVVRSANSLPAGLAAYFYTTDAARCARLSEQLQHGIVGVNDSLPGAVQAPFGGIRQSGIGKEGGRMGLEEFLDTKFVSMAL